MILVTGANSMLGTNTVAQLLRTGYKVRALVRHSNEVLDGAEVIIGDVNSDKELYGALQGCSAVIHIAAITAQNLLTLEDYRFNWECAERVAEAAANCRVERMILISSSNTVGNGTEKSPATEEHPLASPYADSLYTQSKIRAEKWVLRKFPQAIILNPGFMIGAYDAKPSSGAIITHALGHRIVFAPPGGKSFVHVADVAQAIVSALNMGRPGQRYLATGVQMSVKEFYELLQQVTGRSFRTVVVPAWLLIGVGYMGTFLRKFWSLEIPLSAANMKILCRNEYYDNSKIREELGMPQSSIAQAISDAVEWMTINHRHARKRF